METESEYLNRCQSWLASGARATVKKYHLQMSVDLNSIAQVMKRIPARFVAPGEGSPASTVPRSQAI